MDNSIIAHVTDIGGVASLTAFAAMLDPQTQHCFRVICYTMLTYQYVGESAEICAATPADTTPPEPPSCIGAMADRAPKISISWREATDDDLVERYRLYRNGTFLSDNVGLAYTDNTVDANSLYCYQVSALDRSGNESLKSYGNCASAAWSSAVEDVGAALPSGGARNTSLALDSSGRPHILYFNGSNLKHATKGTGDWTKSVIDNGTDVAGGASIALDSSGKAHVSYSSKAMTLKYATNASGSWAIDTVDAELVGTYSCIAIGSAGEAHISYYDYSKGTLNGNLKYATNASGSWVATVVDNSSCVGLFTSIALDSAGKAHISYYGGPDKSLKYATNAGGSWTTTVVDNTGMVGKGSSIAVDPAGTAHISYHDEMNRALKYAINQSGGWAPTIVTAHLPDGTGSMTSLALDASGKVHIVMSDPAAATLLYATNPSGIWKVYDIAPEAIGGSAVRIDSFGNVHVGSCQSIGSMTGIVYSILNFN